MPVNTGEHHVFRFNNPEEVRKLRDRAMAKSNLSISTTAAELQALGEDGTPNTRPDSPTSSSVDLADADWNFAKREAAFARLGLDPALDSLPDDDLNKLFEKITRVKAMRGAGPRPESSLSQADDIWSESGRPFASDALTDDTSVDAGTSHDSPEMPGSLKEVQSQLETQRMEFEQKLQAITEASEADDLKAEKEQMEHQLKLVQVHMKRLLDARARGEDDADIEPFEPVIYTAKQLRLIRKVLDKWRAHRSFSMSEVVLSNAVHVKEANVIRLVVYRGFYAIFDVDDVSARNSGRVYRTISLLRPEAHWLHLLPQSTLLPAWINLAMCQIQSSPLLLNLALP